MKHKEEKETNDYDLLKHSQILQPSIEPTISKLGFRLLKLSFVRENQTNYLRLTITHSERNVSLNDCELISKEVSKELDIADSIPFPYSLEVQSPGIDNNLNYAGACQFELKDLGLVIKS